MISFFALVNFAVAARTQGHETLEHAPAMGYSPTVGAMDEVAWTKLRNFFECLDYETYQGTQVTR